MSKLQTRIHKSHCCVCCRMRKLHVLVLMYVTSVHASVCLHYDVLEPFLTYRGRLISWAPLARFHCRRLWPLPLIWMQMIVCLNIYLCASASKSVSFDLNWIASCFPRRKMRCEGRQIWHWHCKHTFEHWLKLNVSCHLFFFFSFCQNK